MPKQTESNLSEVLKALFIKIDYMFLARIYLSLFAFFITSLCISFAKSRLELDYGSLTAEVYFRGLDVVPLSSAGVFYLGLLSKFNEKAITQLCLFFSYLGLCIAFRPGQIKKIIN